MLNIRMIVCKNAVWKDLMFIYVYCLFFKPVDPLIPIVVGMLCCMHEANMLSTSHCIPTSSTISAAKKQHVHSPDENPTVKAMGK